nr:retrovirus-related Pol polyprotein from transposon TNT 1-94 [Tanacetum cinerariifolium]
MEDLKQQYLDELKRLSNLEYRDEWAYLSTHPSKCLTSFCFDDDDDDDEDYTSAITPNEPVLSTEEPNNSLSMGDEHLDIIPVTESDEFIKSGVETLIPIPSESEGILEHVCDVPSHDNSPPLDVSKYQFEDFSESNEEFFSIDDDSFSINDIDYVEASPLDSELVNSEVMEIVILEVGGIDDDILLTIKHDVLREKLLIVNLLISKIEALNANPTPSSDCKTKSSSTSLNSLLEETNTFDNSLLEFETFCFDVEEISSGSTTTPSDISLPEYEVFYDDHVKEISSGSTTTPSDISLPEYEVFYDDHVKEISSGKQMPSFNSIVRAFALLGHDLEVLRFDLAICYRRPLHFAIEDFAFCYRRSCVLLKKNLAFCSRRILRFSQEESCVLLKVYCVLPKSRSCVLSKKTAICSRSFTAFCLNPVLRFVKTSDITLCDNTFGLQMHNNIMAAGSKDRPPMLAPGRYTQWRSRFLRYVDTRPNGEALRKCILSGPYKPSTVLVHDVEATDNSPAVAEHTTLETPVNMSPENKAHFLREEEAIHLILTGIGDDIYLIVDACQTAQEMWEAIKRLQQGKSLNIQDVKTNLFWEFGKFTSNDGETMESYYTRFYKLMNEMIKNNLTVTTMQVPRDKDMQKNLDLIAKYFKKIYKPTNNNLRTSLNSKNKNVDTTPRENVGSKPKRVKNSAYHKEKMLLCKKAEQGIPLQAEQYDWLANTDEEVDEQELEAHYRHIAKIQEVPIANSNTDSEPLEQNDQNDVESDDERVMLANLKLNVDEKKKIQKQLKKANTTLAQELTECKAVLAETSKSLRESISVRDSFLVALQTKQTEFEKYKAFNDHTIDYDKLKLKLKEALGQIAHKDMVIREGLKTKAYELSVVSEKHDELMKQSLLTKSHYKGLVIQKTKVITDLKLREEHDIEKMFSMEKQIKFLNEIVYKRSTFANPRYLKQAQSEIPCLYAYPYDQNSHANRLIPDGDETLALERESRSKLNKDKVRPYDYTKLNSLYEIFKPPTQEYETQLAHANEIRRTIICDDAWTKHSKDLFYAPTALDMELLIQTCLMPLAIMTESDSLKFVHELKQEMHTDLKYVESLEKEIDELESEKAEFLDMYDEILTKKPTVVPISTRKPKSQANKSIETPNKKKVTSKSTNQKPQSYFRVLYENTKKEWKWWIERQRPSGYKWVPKAKKQWVPKAKMQWVPKAKVYYIEGLNHNLFLVGQFCDANLEVAFRKSTCFVRDLQGNDLLVGNRGSDLYTISLQESTSSTLLCLMAKATPTQTWIKYVKDQLCSSCELSKAKRSSFKSRAVPSSKGRLNLLHMDLCGPMQVASINGKKYILVIVDDYSRDGKNLDKMKEKEDQFILVGYSTQSKGYHVYNKRTRMIVESIYICFDEIKEVLETSVANKTSGLVPQRQKASYYDNPDPVPQRKDVYSLADADVPSQQELDMLFGPLYDEFFNAGSNPSTNIQSTSAPSTHTNMHAEENNNDQAEEGEHVPNDEFTNPFCTPIQEVAETSSHNIVQTRRQLATDPEMCMFALTVSMAEPKNIKEVMVDSAWIEAMQEELHQFDRLQVWELVDIPYGKLIIKLKWLWKNKNDEDQTVIRNKARLVAKGTQVFSNLSDGRKNGISKLSTEGGDADHAGCIDSRKSTSGGIQFLGDKLVSWTSKKQNCTAMSSAKAEYVALSASCAQVMWMRTQLQDYGFNYNKIPLYCDSQSAITISCNLVQHSCTKYIHTRYHFIKEQVENGIIELYFVRTEYQLADMFTKALSKDRFKYLVSLKLFLQDIQSFELKEKDGVRIMTILRNGGCNSRDQDPLLSNSNTQILALDFTPWAVFTYDHPFQGYPWHCIGNILSNSLITVADLENRLHLLNPSGQTNDPFTTMETHRLQQCLGQLELEVEH